MITSLEAMNEGGWNIIQRSCSRKYFFPNSVLSAHFSTRSLHFQLLLRKFGCATLVQFWLWCKNYACPTFNTREQQAQRFIFCGLKESNPCKFIVTQNCCGLHCKLKEFFNSCGSPDQASLPKDSVSNSQFVASKQYSYLTLSISNRPVPKTKKKNVSHCGPLYVSATFFFIYSPKVRYSTRLVCLRTWRNQLCTLFYCVGMWRQ